MFNIKPPAHSEIYPSEIKWIPASQDEILFIKEYLDGTLVKNVQKKYVSYSCGLVGHYKTKDDHFFIKVLDEASNQTQAKSEQVVFWLDKLGIRVNGVKDGYPKKVKDKKIWIYLYDYIEHKFFFDNKESMYQIGKELEKIHNFMKNCPFSVEAFTRGSKKNEILLQQLNMIKNGLCPKSLSKDAISLIRGVDYNEYDKLTLSAQMIHGDVNAGNILFTSKSNQPVFIDFEDSTSSWLSPLYDLAFIVQRFIISTDISHQEKITLSQFLFKGYDSNKLQGVIGEGLLYIMIKLISIRSLLILSTLSNDEKTLYADEIDKFVHLYKETKANKTLILDIEAMVNSL